MTGVSAEFWREEQPEISFFLVNYGLWDYCINYACTGTLKNDINGVS
jgi:hypothetical protein